MKILVLAPQPFFQHRGTPIAVKSLVTSLAAAGNAIDLLVFSEGEDIEIPNCRILRIVSLTGTRGIRPGFSLKKVVCDILMFIKVLKLVTFNRYDVIHAVEEAAFMAAFIRLVFRIPFVYDMDSSLPQQLSAQFRVARSGFVLRMLRFSEGFAVRRSAGVLVVCKALEEIVRTYAPDKLIGRLHDTSLLNFSAEADDHLCDQFALDGPILMYVGNLESYQGIDLLLESFRLTREQIANAELVIVGGDDLHIQHYRRLANDLSIARNIRFVGPRPTEQLACYLRQADVLVSPRIDGDNTPMKIYSYLDSGRPVVATRLYTHTQILDDDIACLVDPNPKSMSEGFVRLLNDPKLRERLAVNAKMRVTHEYSPAAFDRQLNDFYERLENAICGRPPLQGRLV